MSHKMDEYPISVVAYIVINHAIKSSAKSKLPLAKLVDI